MQISNIVAVGGGLSVAIAAIAAAIALPRRSPAIAPEQPRPSIVMPAPVQSTVPEPSPAEVLAGRLRAAKTLGDALLVVRPYLTDAVGESSPGTSMLALWSTQSLQWPDVDVQKDETSYALTMKDPDEARGKRLCLAGPIVQIAKDGVGKLRYFSGLMQSAREDLFRFSAVKSTGELVEGDSARFCGVVIGTFDYRNSAGGTGHAVNIVGMFDLPDNRK
jgi:hypothetical protein